MKNKHNHVNSSSPVFSTTITSLSHDGRGIAISPNGKTIFIEGALLNETVSYRVIKKFKNYSEGQVVEIITPSSDRVTPECIHYDVCGGCSMQHISMPEQIRFKQKVLLEHLQHFGKVKAEIILPPISENSWGYRRKARLGVRYLEKQNKIIIGFRKKASQTLAELKSCLILHKSVGLQFNEIVKLLESLSVREHIPQIEVAIGDHASALIFRHLKDLAPDDIIKCREFGKKLQLDIYSHPNSPATIEKIWLEDKNQQLSYMLPDYQLEMLFHPQDFTQVNGEVNPLMIKQALALLDLQAEDVVLDLFCGLGNFTLPIARHAKSVTGVEGSMEIVNRAKHNAQHNNISNTEFYAANLAEVPSTKPGWMKKHYDKILLDPPRTGAKEIIGLFPKFSAKRIVYVSCNTATLARDAGELVHKQGYTLTQCGIINMFPHTSHIEAMALFEKT